MVKVGDKVRYTGEDKYDLTNGGIYTVSLIDDYGDLAVIDDVGDANYFICDRFEKVESEDSPTCYNYAEQAEKYGIKITVTVGDVAFTFDGTK